MIRMGRKHPLSVKVMIMIESVIVMSGRDAVTLLSISPHCQC